MLVFVVGIYDFGSAFALKEKIGNVTREGVRFASNLPSTDLSVTGTCGAPPSICSVQNLVDANLIANKLNDCGLAGAAATALPNLSWTFTTASPGNGCPGGLTLTVERGVVLPSVLLPTSSVAYTIEATRVTIQYPYAWTFNRVITLVAPGASYPGTSELRQVALMQNLE
jgi:hypothetical protein